MLVEMAVADAYAIPWEFTDQQEGANDLSTFYQHPTYLELKPGQYTDDTQRSAANALVILSSDPSDKFNPERYAQSYLNVARMDPREGYSRGYQAFLASVNTGYDFLTHIERTKVSNGSLMGVAPLGFLSDPREIKLAAAIQALTTHHQDTIIHAQIVALSAHYFLHREGDRDKLFQWLLGQDIFRSTEEAGKFLNDSEDYALGGKTGIKARTISAYMLYAVTKFNNLTEIMTDAVARGGDTDSAAAVAVAVASCSPEIDRDIPQHLFDKLDESNPGYGLEWLNTIENKLRNFYRVG